MTATAKQTAYASKLFDRHASISARHGSPLNRVDYAEDMTWLGMDPNSARDVSKYIGMYGKSAHEARTTMRRY